MYNFIFSFRLGSLVTVVSPFSNYSGPYNCLKCCIFPFSSPSRPEPRFDHHAPSATGVKELTQPDTGPHFYNYLKSKLGVSDMRRHQQNWESRSRGSTLGSFWHEAALAKLGVSVMRRYPQIWTPAPMPKGVTGRNGARRLIMHLWCREGESMANIDNYRPWAMWDPSI